MQLILASHGKLAEGMANAVQMIMGDAVALKAFGLKPGMTGGMILKDIEAEIACHPGEQTIVITDLFRGSVCNACMALVGRENVIVMSGMHMALVLAIALSAGSVSVESLRQIIEDANKNVRVFSREDLQVEDESFF